MIRYDRAELKVRIDGDGFLYDSPTVARTGILVYRNPDGSVRRELRTRKDAEQGLASMVGKPIVLTHAVGTVNAKTAKKHAIGTILAARQDGNLTNTDIVIHDASAITMAQDHGYRELSLAYKIREDKSPGYYNADTDDISAVPQPGYEPFDIIQRDIAVNNLALVKSARAGRVARLNFDGDEIIHEEEITMQKVRLDNGIEYDCAPEVAAAFNAQKTRLDGIQAELDTAKAKTDAVTAERDTLKARVDGIPEELKQARLDAAEQIKARNELEGVAGKLSIKCDGMDSMEVKKAVIGKTTKVNLDGKSDDYINAAFDIAVTSLPAEKQVNPQLKVITGSRMDSSMTTADAAKQRMYDKQFGGAK